MGNVIQFIDRKKGDPIKGITKEKVTKQLNWLIWNNPKAFLTLELLIYSNISIQTDNSIKATLRELELIDDQGYPTKITKMALKDINDYVNKQTIITATY